MPRTPQDQGLYLTGRYAKSKEAFCAEGRRQEEQGQRPRQRGGAKLFGQERRRSQVTEKIEMFEGHGVNHVLSRRSSSEAPSDSFSDTAPRHGCNERRRCTKKPVQYLRPPAQTSSGTAVDWSMPDVSRSSLSGYQRTRSLDRKATDSSMTWKKYWFVLTDQSLRYFKDSLAEEILQTSSGRPLNQEAPVPPSGPAADLDGEIDLSTCYDVTEFPMQRNYGFQIHTKEGIVSLSAMTSGIRRSWIQAIMKNIHPTIAPDVTRKNASMELSFLKSSTISEEKARVRPALRNCHQHPADLLHRPESPARDGTMAAGATCSAGQRKGRIRDRQREGCSKTFEWAEIHQTSTQGNSTAQLVVQPDKTTDAENDCSTTSSITSSSPLGSSGCSSSLQEQTQRHGERRRRLKTVPGATPTTDRPNTGTPAAGGVAKTDGERDEEKTEACTPPSIPKSWDECNTGHPDLREEMEQHRLQQEPMQLMQAQSEPAKLQEENSLQETCTWEGSSRQGHMVQEAGDGSSRQGHMLQEARERTSRQGQGDLLPRPSSSECADSRLCIAQLSQDLQLVLEVQKKKQDLSHQQLHALKQSFSEAKDLILRHEAEIQVLQSKVSDAGAELLARDQALATVQGKMVLEHEHLWDWREEWGHSEQALRAQLLDSEDRLKHMEAHLLEKTQDLGDLELQQALQRDHMKEVQKLQQRLSDITNRLIATEGAQALKEEGVQTSQEVPRESWEEERQSLVEHLAEAEARSRSLENRLQKAEEQVQELLGKQHVPTLERCELVHRLEDQLLVETDTVQELTEMTQQLRDEKDQLTCDCQELLNQITEANNEVSKLKSRLKAEETDYYSLERSYQKVYEDFQRMNRVLLEREEELQQVKDMYEEQVEIKEKELNEALVKMAAMGSSLEETELKLRMKEELICKVGQGNMELCNVGKDLQTTLAANQILELQQQLKSKQLACTPLQTDCGTGRENSDILETSSKQGEGPSSLTDAIHVGGSGKLFGPSEISQHFSEENHFTAPSHEFITSTGGDMDTEKFIHIIHMLETKLLTTEEMLKAITLKLEEQQGPKMEAMKEQHLQRERTEEEEEEKEEEEEETELQSQLSDGVSHVDHLSTHLLDKRAIRHSFSEETDSLQEEGDNRHCLTEETDCHRRIVNAKYGRALACLELSRDKVQAMLKSSKEISAEAQRLVLADVEGELASAILYVRQGGGALDEQQQDHQATQDHKMKETKVSYEDRIKLGAKIMEFEAMFLNKIAFSVQNPDGELLEELVKIQQETENLKRGDGGYMAIAYADVLVRKLMLQFEFWEEVKKLEMQYESSNGGNQGEMESGQESSDATSRTCILTGLEKSIQNLERLYDERLQKLQGHLLEAYMNLKCREFTLKEIMNASQIPAFKGVSQRLNDELDCSVGKTLADISPPELAPYEEQINIAEAHDSAEDIINIHIQRDMLTCRIKDDESLDVRQDRLVADLKGQAEVLKSLSLKMEMACATEASSFHHKLVNVLSRLDCNKNVSDVTSRCLYKQGAMIQAQTAYVACKLGADEERDLKQCEKNCQDVDFMCQEHDCTVGRSEGDIHEWCETSLQEECESLAEAVSGLRQENRALRREVSQYISAFTQQQEQVEKLEEHFQAETEALRRTCELAVSQAEQKFATNELSLVEKSGECKRKLDVVLQDIENMEDRHEEHVQKLEAQFQGRIKELQQAHVEEVKLLHMHYAQTLCKMQGAPDRLKGRNPEDSPLPELTPATSDKFWPMMEQLKATGMVDPDTIVMLREKIRELEKQADPMQDETGNKYLEEDVCSLKEKYQKDLENLKATCELGFTVMEETHQRVIQEIQRQHQMEVSKLLEERERLLAEETAATISGTNGANLSI
ncbi:hypothetical protein JZ751_015068 [Albula glossodonta]|uniref:PH domain-containing protein n=1 Tax=Albula glossodonta TaxID=121402 RepID=A0A8T2NUS4_9TELE|nr:hypothetical protein JZ751_015068 [Albula glossodonta]